MRQFDVYENPSPRRREIAPYFVVLSSHLLLKVDEVVVAPLVLEREVAIGDIELRLEFKGRTYLLMIPGLFSLPGRALDRLFAGF